MSLSALELKDIHKSFARTSALGGASLTVTAGSVHALLGENGAGKSTLMRIAFGMTPADSGTVLVDGVPRQFESPADAIEAGIGMVHQHFALVPSMTVAENVALGGAGRYRHDDAIAMVERWSLDVGLDLDPRTAVCELSIGGQQRVEILKALSRNARILILDEPTAVLPPTEAESLLSWIRAFAQADRAAVLITHKVRDAMRIADDITVLRHGRVVFSGPRASVSEDALARAMVDQQATETARAPLSPGTNSIVELDRVSVTARGRRHLDETSLEIHGGELLGVAGVEASGHHELLRVIAGKLRPSTGKRSGTMSIGFIPEDRQREALAMEMTTVENVALSAAGGHRGLMNWRAMREKTRAITVAHDVRGPTGDSPVRHLSGGNQQKLVLGRELANNPELIVAESPTRGLDIQASAAVHARLTAARDRGAAVVVYSRDIDELLSVCDRMLVVHAGRVSEVPLDVQAVTRALVGSDA